MLGAARSPNVSLRPVYPLPRLGRSNLQLRQFCGVDASGSEALYADLGVTGEIAAGEISTLNCSHQTTTD